MDTPPHRPDNVTIAKITDLPEIIALDGLVTGLEKPDIWYGYFTAMHNAGVSFLVARQDERIVGYAVGGVRAWEFGSPPCGWIFAIGVRPDARQSGIASTLFEAICAQFATAGVAAVRTMLHIDAHLLMAFFRSRGMRAGPFVELEMPLS